MKANCILLTVSVFLAGCTSTVWVKERVTSPNGEKKYEKIGGIPFYIKKEVFNQATSYAVTWLNATLTVEKTLVIEKDGKRQSIVLGKQALEKRLLKSQLPDLDRIKLRILGTGVLGVAEAHAIASEFSELRHLVDFSDLPKDDVIENTLASSWVVNEDEKYYLNAPLPWFGSSNLTQKINPDGTLSEVGSNPDTKLAEGISSLIPFKEYLSGKYVETLKNKTDEFVLAELGTEKSTHGMLARSSLHDIKLISDLTYNVTLTVVESGYIYKFTKTYEEAPTHLHPLEFSCTKNACTRVSLGEKTAGVEAKDDGKSVGISGTVNFPKDW